MAWQLSALSPLEPSDICSACKRITLEMIFTGFEHSLTYKQTIESGRYCRLCRLMVCSYARLQVHFNAYQAEQNYESLIPQLNRLRAVFRNSLAGTARRELGPIKEDLVEPPEHLRWAVHEHWQRVNGCFSDGCTIQVSAQEGE